jgi:hypothetical protein
MPADEEFYAVTKRVSLHQNEIRILHMLVQDEIFHERCQLESREWKSRNKLNALLRIRKKLDRHRSGIGVSFEDYRQYTPCIKSSSQLEESAEPEEPAVEVEPEGSKAAKLKKLAEDIVSGMVDIPLTVEVCQRYGLRLEDVEKLF